MLAQGPAKKLIIYVNEQEHWQNEPIHEAILHFLHKHGCAGATVTKAVAGFGARGQYHTAKLLQVRENLPMRIEVIESEQKIDSLLPWIYEMVTDGLIEVQDTEVIKCANRQAEQEQTHKPHVKLEGQAKMLRIYIDEDDRWESEPLYEAVVKKLRMMDIAGATVYQGVMGYGAQQRMRKSGFLGIKHNLPFMITVVDSEEKIRRAIAALEEMVDEGLIVMSDVEVIKYVRSYPESGVVDTPEA
jgi:PII-like signaling protein